MRPLDQQHVDTGVGESAEDPAQLRLAHGRKRELSPDLFVENRAMRLRKIQLRRTGRQRGGESLRHGKLDQGSWINPTDGRARHRRAERRVDAVEIGTGGG